MRPHLDGMAHYFHHLGGNFSPSPVPRTISLRKPEAGGSFSPSWYGGCYSFWQTIRLAESNPTEKSPPDSNR